MQRSVNWGLACLRGVDRHDANERANASGVVLPPGKSGLRNLNPHVPEANIDAVVASLARPPHPTLIENNRYFNGLLTDGVPVEYKDAKTGEMRRGRAR